MEGKNESKHTWTVQKCPCADPNCGRYTVESNFLSKNDAELIAASAPALLEENERLKAIPRQAHGESFDDFCKRSGNSAKAQEIISLKAEVDRLTKEKSELIEGINKYALHWFKFFGDPKVGQPPHVKDLTDLLTRIK